MVSLGQYCPRQDSTARKTGRLRSETPDQEIRLTIGETSSLKRRVSYLVRGDGPHSAGEKIRGSENVADIEVRWAVTEQYGEIERQLHQAHRERFGCLPLYTKRTGRTGW